MKIKVKRTDGTVLEVEADYQLQAGEAVVPEIPPQLVQMDMKDFGEFISEKLVHVIESLQKDRDTRFKTLPKETDTQAEKMRKLDCLVRAFAQPGVVDNNLLSEAGAGKVSGGINRLSVYGESRVLSQTDADGGYLMPVDIRLEVQANIGDFGIARKLATVIPFSTEEVNLNAFLTGVDFAIATELTAAAATNPTFDRVTIKPEDIVGLADASNRILSDATTLYASLVGAFAQGLARVEDVLMLTQASTFLGLTQEVAATGGFTDTAIAATDLVTGNISIDEVITFTTGQLDSSTSQGAVIICSPTVLAKFFGIKNAQGQPVFLPLMGAGFQVGGGILGNVNGVPVMGFLAGYPVIVSSVMPPSTDIDATGEIFLYMGNPKNAFHIADRQQMIIATSQHATVNAVNYFTSRATGILFAERIGTKWYNKRRIASGLGASTPTNDVERVGQLRMKVT